MKIPQVSASEAKAGRPRMVLIRTWTCPLGLMQRSLELGGFESVNTVAQRFLASGANR